MCSAYWTLEAVDFVCPHCGALTKESLQTHFMGEPGSCQHRYELGQPVAELAGIEKARLGASAEGCPDDFIGSCGECDESIDFAAEIDHGRVIRVWPYTKPALDSAVFV